MIRASSAALLLLALSLFAAVLASPHPASAAVDAAVRADADDKMSPEPTATSEADSDDEVCVDHAWVSARHPTADLVHAASPPVADVLCIAASDLPCMTRHHMVRVAGEDMSAEELCNRAHVTCTAKRMAVNSVLSHKWTETQHGDVTLTMLDARHPAALQFALHRSMSAARWLARHSASARAALVQTAKSA